VPVLHLHPEAVAGLVPLVVEGERDTVVLPVEDLVEGGERLLVVVAAEVKSRSSDYA
jgi:hypothetical protein